jgi:hypothetical protein
MVGQATPPADENGLRFEELPMAGGRTASHAIVREAGLIASGDHGACIVTASAGAECARHGFPLGGGGGQ